MIKMDKKQFETLDWVLFAGMLIISATIGIFYAIKDSCTKKSGDTGEYLMGGRKMRTLPVAISILVSFLSAITILGNPAEMYTTGTLFVLYLLGISLGAVLSSLLFVPLLYPLKLTSCFEYLELRFQSKVARLTGTFIMVIQQILYIGVAAYAPSTALEAVTDFPIWATITTVGCLSTFYTFLGGMKAVVWTDVFQCVVMVAGVVAIIIKGIMEVGGIDIVWEMNEEWGRIDFWEADPDPTVRHSAWSLIVGGAVSWFVIYGVSQASVQRYSSVSSLRDAKNAVRLNIIGMAVLVLTTSLAGLVMFAYYAKIGCDPLTDKQVANPNQLIPLFVMDVLRIPGLPGLFISSLFSGALSSVSSSLNSLSAVTWEDVLKPLIGHRTSEKSRTWITKVLVVLYGGAGIGFAFIAKNFGGTLLQLTLSFTGASTGPHLGIFLLGALFPWANWMGCTVGGIVGLALPLWMSLGAYSLPRGGYSLDFPTENCTVEEFNQTLTTATALTTSTTSPNSPVGITGVEQLYTVSYLWYPSIGAATAVIVGLIVSCITGPMRIDETDPKYLIPLFDRLFCCLPKSLRKKLRCNLHFRDPEAIAQDEKDKGVQRSNSTEKEERSSSKLQEHDREIFKGQARFVNGIAMLSYKPKQDSKFVYDNKGCNVDDKGPMSVDSRAEV